MVDSTQSSETERAGQLSLVPKAERRGDYFDPVNYDLTDPGVGEEFRYERGLETAGLGPGNSPNECS